jgi:hypothetical protein
VTSQTTARQIDELADALYRVRAASIDHRAADGLTPGHILAVADATKEDLIAAAARGGKSAAELAEVEAALQAGEQHVWAVLATAALNPIWWKEQDIAGERMEITWSNGARESIKRLDSKVLHLEFGADGTIVFPETGKQIGSWRPASH